MKKLLAILLAGLLLAGCTPAPEAPPSSSTPSFSSQESEEVSSLPDVEESSVAESANTVPEGLSAVFVQRDTDGTDDGVTRLIASMEASGVPFYKTLDIPEGIVGANDVVLLKINCQWAYRGGTNTDLLYSVAKAVADHPEGLSGEIVFVDNGQGQYGTNGDGGSFDWTESNSLNRDQSTQDVIDQLQGEGVSISGFLWDSITMNRVQEYSEGDSADGYVVGDEIYPTGSEVTYPKCTTAQGNMVSFKEGVWDGENYDSDRLTVINLPVLKQHGIYQVTGAVKAYMGVVANRITEHRAHNNVGSGFMGTQMAHSRIPDLNVMDMIWIGVDGGPGVSYEGAVERDMIAASTDPVALDYWCAKYVLMPAMAELPGQTGEAQSPDGSEPGTFGYWLALTARELEQAGIPARMGDNNLYVVE
ncbi:MAG: DUF362 domain-containing protein [Oscillospiraceae bacterium]